ncbi:MAG: hypothetical protein AB7F75_05205 [Planctomycetota bacterium]
MGLHIVHELLKICHSIADDGKLTKNEIVNLSKWLRAHENSGLPTIDVLAKKLTKILDDGYVSKEEQKALLIAIEGAIATLNEKVHEAELSKKAFAEARSHAEVEKARSRLLRYGLPVVAVVLIVLGFNMASTWNQVPATVEDRAVFNHYVRFQDSGFPYREAVAKTASHFAITREAVEAIIVKEGKLRGGATEQKPEPNPGHTIQKQGVTAR